MTDAMKRKFLRGEGWERRWYSLFGGRDRLSYWDPVTADHLFDLDLAYRIATRRKAARDRARLRKAGCDSIKTVGGWRWTCRGPGGYWLVLAKSGALALLDGGAG